MSIRDFFKPATSKKEDGPAKISVPKSPPYRKPLSRPASKNGSPVKAGRRAQAFIIDDSDSDDEILKQMPESYDDGNFEPSDEEEDKDLPMKKPAKRPAKVADAESKRPKSDASAVPQGEEKIDSETPKKKSKYQCGMSFVVTNRFSYHAFMARKQSAPVAVGSKEIPTGAPNCLEGLAFVFTGDLSAISRDEATDLVKRYGGRVTTSPSGKTDYVVVGANPGESKMSKIQQLNLKTLDEDSFLQLIRDRSAKLGFVPEPSLPAADATQKPAAEPLPCQTTSDIIERVIHSETKQAEVPKANAPIPSGNVEEKLWTVKYAPKLPTELIGNYSNYEKLIEWLKPWTSPNAPHEFRAVLLSGPPGIGKTSMAHMACKVAGFDVVELNASDTRSKKTLHDEVREVTTNTSLAGFFGAKKAEVRKQAIVMDECDGMSAGDRGGMAELIQIIKKSKVPIICICNDRASPKVRSLANYCLDLRFRRPDARQIVPRIAEICKKEGINLSANAIEELVASTQSDIRQIINLLSTFRLTCTDLTFDASKKMGESSKKDIEEGPFDAVHQLLSGQSFNRMTMNQKLDLYFIDSSLMPLMVQENYLKSRASTPRTVYDPAYGAGSNFMTLAWAAADSISQADGVDALIRGYNQEWSLAPLHAMFSTVRPAYFCSGNLSGRIDFASWLGQNSKQQKYQRLAKELAQHLYLHTRANRLTTCLDYAPTMASVLMNRLRAADVNAGVDEAIKFLDGYALSKEDVEPLLDLVLDPNCNLTAYGKLPTATKSAFTRRYNQGTHMLPYSMGTTVPVKRVKTDVLAEDFDEENELEEEPAAEQDEQDDDISKDKMIKAKKGPATKAKAAPKKK